MAIKRPEQMDFSQKSYTMIISGTPGLGKTTLALSAPDPILFDFDQGIARVRAEHRTLTSECETYADFLSDLKSPEVKASKSIILDTGGSLVQLMQPWAKQQEPKAARDGRAMFGVIKREFDRLCAEIRHMNKNLIIIFHTIEQQKGDIITQRLSCEGSAKDIVWTPADLGANMFMMGKKRMLGFTPTEEYFAKSCYGIKGIMEVPELPAGAKNDFLTRLFEQATANIAAEMSQYTEERKTYDAAMQQGRETIEKVADAETATIAAEALKNLSHALTSKAELLSLLTDKTRSMGLKWDKKGGCYVAA